MTLVAEKRVGNVAAPMGICWEPLAERREICNCGLASMLVVTTYNGVVSLARRMRVILGSLGERYREKVCEEGQAW